MATLVIGVVLILIGLAAAFFAGSEDGAGAAAAWIVIGVVTCAIRAAFFLGESLGW